MASPPFLSCAQALLGARLLHHELHKLLEGQRRSVEPFEREGFEQLGPLNEQPGTGFGRQVQGHTLACQGLPDIIVFQIDAHGAIATNRAHEMQAITDLQPTIRVDDVGDWGQFGQAGKGGARWTIATTVPLMRTLPIVVLLELRSDGPHLLQGDTGQRGPG